MNIHISYFSSTGNTLFVVSRMKVIFESEGHHVELFEVIKDGLSFLQNADMTGIVYPVWCSTLPEPYWDLISRMEDGKGKKMFLIGNCGAFTGDTGMHWKKKIEHHGYDVFYIDHIILPVNINIPGFNIWKVPDTKKKEKIFNKADIRIKKICTAICEGKRKVDGTGPLARLGGGIQRKFYGVTDYWKKKFMIDPARCIKCRLCEKMCPVHNINLDSIIKNDTVNTINDNHGDPVTVYSVHIDTRKPDNGENCFGSQCILCMKCYNLCPEDAILIGKESWDTEKFRRYKGPSADFRPILYR
jgi:ferredoxin/flavodoxin